MTDNDIISQVETRPAAARELSAARLARDVASLLDRAFHSSTLQKQELAERLGVSAGAVSQVLNGDGNVRIATLARYLRALGYAAELTLVAIDATSTPQASSASVRRGRRKAVASETATTPGHETLGAPSAVGSMEGVRRSTWTVMDHQSDAVFNVPVTYRDSPVKDLVAFQGVCSREVSVKRTEVHYGLKLNTPAKRVPR